MTELKKTASLIGKIELKKTSKEDEQAQKLIKLTFPVDLEICKNLKRLAIDRHIHLKVLMNEIIAEYLKNKAI